jgi:hypothetical protein
VYHVSTIGWQAAEAERAFARVVRARRRASLRRRFLRRCAECARLVVHREGGPQRPGARRGMRDIPIEQIAGSLEPHRAAHFDREFRPSRPARHRWLGIWQAEERGVPLPPILVVPVPGGYAVRDGHHRVSVARARGARTITAIVA